MSSRTSGVAVAVTARTGSRPPVTSAIALGIMAYSGRNE